jgi:hypothetical protein
MRSNCRDDYEC